MENWFAKLLNQSIKLIISAEDLFHREIEKTGADLTGDTYTLTYTPATDSEFVFHQNNFLHKNIGYTISGKVITFLVPVQTADRLEFWYLRSD